MILCNKGIRALLNRNFLEIFVVIFLCLIFFFCFFLCQAHGDVARKD